MKKILFALILLVINEAGAQEMDLGKLNKNEQQVWQQVVALNSHVFGTKDSAQISSFIKSNLHYGHSNGVLENATQMVHNASVNRTAYSNVSHQLLSLKMLDDVAIVRYVLKGTSTEANVEAPLHLGIIQVWQNDKNKWLLVERQAVKLTVPKP